MKIDANRIFEDELSRRGFSFVREDEDIYRIKLEGREISVNLVNVRRNAERDRDPTTIIRFVDKY